MHIDLWLQEAFARNSPTDEQWLKAIARCADPETLIVTADRALYRAAGGGRYPPAANASCRRISASGYLRQVPNTTDQWELVHP